MNRYDPRPAHHERRIKSAVLAHERRPRNQLRRGGLPLLYPDSNLSAVTSSAITAASGSGAATVFGTGNADLKLLNSDGTLSDLGINVVVLSQFKVSINAGQLISVVNNCGQWTVDGGDCSISTGTGGGS